MNSKNIIVIVLITLSCNTSNQDFEFVILNSDSVYVDWQPEDYGHPSGLTKIELRELDKKLLEAVETYPTDDLLILSTETINIYRRQYVPYINRNDEKIVRIYGFCRVLKIPVETSPGNYELGPWDWKRNIIWPDDGGDCYWTFYANLTIGENHLRVNGI